MPERVNVNGRIGAPQEAAVSPLDRGFLYGDSVYETIRTYGGRPFRLAAHLVRLRASADRLGIPHARAPVDVATEIARTLADAGDGESAIRVILSRGVGPPGYDPEGCGPPTVVVHVRACPAIPAAFLREGVDVAVVPVRRNAPEALDPAIKSSNLLNNFLAWREARARGAFEPILLNGAGQIAEGASSNLFLVRERTLRTPPLEAGLLRGVTRDLVLDLARRDGLRTHDDAPLLTEDLQQAEEAFLTSTLKGILPIRRCDGWPIGAGRPGPLTRRLLTLFEAEIQAETKTGSLPGSTLR